EERDGAAQFFFGLLAFEGDAGDLRGDINEPSFRSTGAARFAIIDREGGEDFVSGGKNGNRPARPQSMLRCQPTKVSPKRIFKYVRHDDRFTAKGSGSAGAAVRTDGNSVDRAVVFVGQARSRTE